MNEKFAVMWNDVEVVQLVNMGHSEHEQVMRVLLDAPDDPWETCSNPIRDMVINCANDKLNQYEIWEFENDISEEELISESNNAELFKMRIRSIGEQIYSTGNKK